MSGDFLEEMGLRMEGFSDAEIAQIEAATPEIQQLVALAQAESPKIDQAWALIKKLLPVANLVLTKMKAKQS